MKTGREVQHLLGRTRTVVPLERNCQVRIVDVDRSSQFFGREVSAHFYSFIMIALELHIVQRGVEIESRGVGECTLHTHLSGHIAQ